MPLLKEMYNPCEVALQLPLRNADRLVRICISRLIVPASVTLPTPDSAISVTDAFPIRDEIESGIQPLLTDTRWNTRISPFTRAATAALSID